MDTRPLNDTEYGRGFGRALFLRPACHRCPYASLNRPGDFTLGDLWGLEPGELPEERPKGLSLLLVNTSHGSHIFDQLRLSRRPFDLEQAVRGNPQLDHPTAPAKNRAAFFAAYEREPFDQVARRFFAPPPLYRRVLKTVLPPELREKVKGLEAKYKK